ncbi:MAG: hypothetical protein R3F34_01890 [Planctomycetota bacterium]
MERLEHALADDGLDSGFEGLDALEREMERVAREASEERTDSERAVASAASASALGSSATKRSIEQAMERLRSGSSNGALDQDLLTKLRELAERAMRDLSEDGSFDDVEDLEKWLAWMEEWSALQEELREASIERLDRLAREGLLDDAQRDALEEALADLDEAMLDQLAERLAKSLEDLDVDPATAAEMREQLAGLTDAPELSSELQEALAKLQAELDAEFGAVETPPAADVARLLEEIDPALREELFDALADAERRRLEAMEEAVRIDPEAFALDQEQIDALRRALDAMRGRLADWIAEQLQGADAESLAALARSLAREASREDGMDADAREQLASAIEDLFETDARSLAEALSHVPPDVRKELLERLIEQFDGAAQGAAREGDPAAALDPASAAAMVEALERLVEGPPPGVAEALSEDQVRRAIEALRTMRADRPGLGIP